MSLHTHTHTHAHAHTLDTLKACGHACLRMVLGHLPVHAVSMAMITLGHMQRVSMVFVAHTSNLRVVMAIFSGGGMGSTPRMAAVCHVRSGILTPCE